jgi:transcriptional regulator with XRE-family HTH domain
MSQAALASSVGVSQAVISFYENNRTTPSPSVLERLEQALDLERDALRLPARETAAAPATKEVARSLFLRTIDSAEWRAALIDRPASDDGGDLACAVNLRSHVFFIVIDAQGAGETAAPVARMAAACAVGATSIPGGGIAEPDEVVGAVLRLWRLLDMSTQSANMCVVSLDRRAKTWRQCRLGMPAPFVRDARLGQWMGKPEGPAGAYVGERAFEKQSLLVVATDGVADHPTKGASTLWNSPEFRTRMSRAESPEDVVDFLARRLSASTATERRDDRLAIAVMP